MQARELRKTESFLNGRSHSATLRPAITIQHVQRVGWTTGGYALQVMYSVASKQGLWQQQTLINSFEEAVAKLGEAK